MEYCTGFEIYSNIWLDDRQSYMQSFLAYGRQLTMEELELNMIPEEITPPTMEQFRQQVPSFSSGLKSALNTSKKLDVILRVDTFVFQIDSFEVLYTEVEELKSIEIFDKWFQLDISPFKMSLLNAVSKWAMMFKEYLLEHVTNRYLCQISLYHLCHLCLNLCHLPLIKTILPYVGSRPSS